MLLLERGDDSKEQASSFQCTYSRQSSCNIFANHAHALDSQAATETGSPKTCSTQEGRMVLALPFIPFTTANVALAGSL